MVVYNAATRELTAKIVYYGPGLGGKTTNLHLLHDRLDPQTVGKLLNLATQTDRTIYFDLLPVELGDIKGYKIRFQLATVPGQTAFNETRRVVLRGADGIVFVADSQWSNLPKNLESWQNLKDNLKANGVSFEGIPIVVQYNKRDLPDILSVDALQEALGLSSYPFVEAVASAGRGVTETFKLISKLTFVDLLRRLQGRKPEDAAAAPRKDQDDLLSWKESMLNRAQPPMTHAKPRIALVPPAADEAPFEAAELGRLDEDIEVDGPLTGAGRPTTPPPIPTQPEPPPSAPFEAAAPSVSETIRLELPRPPVAPEGAEPPELPDLSELPGLQELPPALAPASVPRPLPSDKHVETTKIPVVPAQSATEVPKPVPAVDDKVRDLEARLAEALARIDKETSRLEMLEGEAREWKTLSDGQTALDGRLAKVEKAQREDPAVARVQALEERVASDAKRQRGAEDDVGMALRSLSERGEQLHQLLDGFATQTQDFAMAIATLAGRMDGLEKTVQEKTSQTRREADDIRSQIETLQTALEERMAQGRREAEDIRTQISPLLEAENQRKAGEQAMPAEFDRLRESLADSLADLSERLRRVVRGR
jgi:signal recognition particle receptor subunit beta